MVLCRQVEFPRRIPKTSDRQLQIQQQLVHQISQVVSGQKTYLEVAPARRGEVSGFWADDDLVSWKDLVSTDDGEITVFFAEQQSVRC